MTFVRTIISAVALACVACASTSTGDAHAPANGCVLPISAYCKVRPCPTYPRALEETRAALASGNVRSMSTGKCGAYLYITHEGMGASTDYYTQDGSLVGTVGMADSTMHCGGFTRTYGVAPQCKEEPIEH